MRKMLTRIWPFGRASETEIDSAPTPKRKCVVPLWRRPQTLAVLGVGMIFAFGGGVMWAVKNGHVQQAYETAKWTTIKTSTDLGLTVQEVLVTGRVETSRDQLLESLGVARGAPILAYDFQAAKERVEALPWVHYVRIERLLPDTLAVHLVERRPMAIWQNQGHFSLIDDTGTVITRKELGRFSNLIQLVGEDAPDHLGGLLELLETQPELKEQVRAAVRVGGRRWDLSLEGGINVRLPELNPSMALARLVSFEETSGVLERDVRVLDLRVPDRVIVRHKANVKRRPDRKPGQET